jgi:hypothetical protein
MLAAVSVAGIVVTGFVLAQARTERPDCPGKITCPQTGEIICRDHCPNMDPDRSDCPGRIVCSSTGELVCKDRCPLNKNGTPAEAEQAKIPSCCAKRG